MTAQAPDKADIATLLARLDELRHAERRAASMRMVSVTGHLIGTPLNVIAGRAALIRSNPSPEAIEGNVRRIEEQVERLALRIRRLIDYFGLPDPPAGRRTVGEILDECAAVYPAIAELKGVSLEICADTTKALLVEAALAPLVLTTLLSLGIRRTDAGQCIRLEVSPLASKAIAFEMTFPGLEPPPTNFERLEPPEQGARYDPDALEALSICLGLARRGGGGLSIAEAEGGVGLRVCFECAHG